MLNTFKAIILTNKIQTVVREFTNSTTREVQKRFWSQCVDGGFGALEIATDKICTQIKNDPKPAVEIANAIQILMKNKEFILEALQTIGTTFKEEGDKITIEEPDTEVLDKTRKEIAELFRD